MEGAFGVLKNNYEFQRFLLRGKSKVKLELLLLCMGYNPNKLHAKIQDGRTAGHLFPAKGAEGEVSTEERYFICSLPVGIEETVRAVRGHWMVESYHWRLDVTFREDGNHTLEKQAAYNLNIIRKLSLNILKPIEVGSKALSLKKKRYAIGTNPEEHLE